MRATALMLMLAVFGVATAAVDVKAAPGKNRLNIVVLVADDVGYSDMGGVNDRYANGILDDIPERTDGNVGSHTISFVERAQKNSWSLSGNLWAEDELAALILTRQPAYEIAGGGHFLERMCQ